MNQSAVIHGVAVDAGSGLEATIKAARKNQAHPDDLAIFKCCVLEVLGQGASTVLVDAQTGPALIPHYPSNCAPMLAYEADVYHFAEGDKITLLPENLKITDYAKLGVKQLKFFMYYAPDDDTELNRKKQEVVASVGQQCVDHDLVFLMEPLVYHPTLKSGTKEYALLKPDLVQRATAEFCQPQYHADVMKVEVPVDLDFVEGFGETVMSRDDAMEAFRAAAAPATNHQLVYLSAGVPFDRFEASLQMAGAAGVDFDGFMCGRALWADAVDIYGAQGEIALRNWLEETGRQRLNRLIAALG